MSRQSDLERMERLIKGRHPCIRITTFEEHYALSVVRETVLRSPMHCRIWTCTEGLRDGLMSDAGPINDTDHPAGALFYLLRNSPKDVDVFLDLAEHLHDAKTLRLFRDIIERKNNDGGHLILIDHCDDLPEVVRQISSPFELALPQEDEITDIVRTVLRNEKENGPLRSGISRNDYQTVLRNLAGLSRRQIKQIIVESVADDRCFDIHDLETITLRKRQMIASGGLLEFVQAPNSLDDIGGMRRLKNWLATRNHAFSEAAQSFGITPPRGVLLLGVQGAGKSFCAKAIATAWSRPLLRMDVGALYDRFIGESERRLRDALHQAEAMAPIILWIDEIEKAFASSASRSSDGGLSQRMFGALLTWMQEHRAPVFLVATANDIEALPPELLRKGRFDEIFFVDLPDAATRREIFEIHLRGRSQDPQNFDLASLVQTADGYTGAEINEAINAALHLAFRDGSPLTSALISTSLQASPPLSVIQKEKIQHLRAWAAGRCVPA